jgi:hypothetical protein
MGRAAVEKIQEFAPERTIKALLSYYIETVNKKS